MLKGMPHPEACDKVASLFDPLAQKVLNSFLYDTNKQTNETESLFDINRLHLASELLTVLYIVKVLHADLEMQTFLQKIFIISKHSTSFNPD